MNRRRFFVFVEYSKKAVKVINRLDAPLKQRIRAAVNALPKGDVRLLSGKTGTWRLRIGDWRVLFSYPERNKILVEKIGPRGQVYKEW
jgi:mRNA interferase RelE/StbE